MTCIALVGSVESLHWYTITAVVIVACKDQMDSASVCVIELVSQIGHACIARCAARLFFFLLSLIVVYSIILWPKATSFACLLHGPVVLS